MAAEDSPFLSRWSRRKTQAREGLPVEAEVAVSSPALPPVAPPILPPALTPIAPAVKALVHQPLPAPVAAELAPAAEAPPDTAPAPETALTLEDVAQLNRDSDYTGFVARGVTPEVKNAALKKLFTDPHFNVMDGLDTYIGDYNTPDPLPEGMLRQMVQSKLLGLFDDDPPAAEIEVTASALAAPSASSALPATDPLPPNPNPADEDADLQLQPDDAAGRPGPEPGPGQDAGRQH